MKSTPPSPSAVKNDATYLIFELYSFQNIGKGPAKIVTAENDAICGVTLLKKKVYLLNGRSSNRNRSFCEGA